MRNAYNKSFFDSLPGAVIVSDSNTRVLYSNEAVEAILKISRDELKHMRLFERVYPADRKKVRQYREILKQTGHMVTQRRFKTGDGTYVIIERNTQLLKDGTQLSVCRLITADEEELKKEDTFASIAGHELRNPLAGIQLNLDLIATQLKKDQSTKELTKFLDNTQYFIDLQSRLIDDLLSFSQLKKGKLSLQKTRFELRPFFAHIIRQIRATTHRNFKLTISKNTPKFITADRDRLYQVCINLLSNAAKFSEAPASIDMRVDYKGGVCEIEVTDYGIGIEKSHRRRIFKDFYQIEPAGSSGLGIGLFLVYEIVKMHQGTLSVESDGLRKGSTFRVRLPA